MGLRRSVAGYFALQHDTLLIDGGRPDRWGLAASRIRGFVMTQTTLPPVLTRTVEVAAEMTSTALVLNETLWAAQQTVFLRMMWMGGAGMDAARLQDPEFTTMIREKLDAALESCQALGTGMLALNDAWLEWLAQQNMAATQALMAIAGLPDPVRLGNATGEYVETSLNVAEIACGRMALEATRLGGRGLAPYHRATNENARRLLGRAAGEG